MQWGHNSRALKLYNVDTVQHSKVIARNTMQLETNVTQCTLAQ